MSCNDFRQHAKNGFPIGKKSRSRTIPEMYDDALARAVPLASAKEADCRLEKRPFFVLTPLCQVLEQRCLVEVRTVHALPRPDPIQ
jgi:hypothetical protein